MSALPTRCYGHANKFSYGRRFGMRVLPVDHNGIQAQSVVAVVLLASGQIQFCVLTIYKRGIMPS